MNCRFFFVCNLLNEIEFIDYIYNLFNCFIVNAFAKFNKILVIAFVVVTVAKPFECFANRLSRGFAFAYRERIKAEFGAVGKVVVNIFCFRDFVIEGIDRRVSKPGGGQSVA